MLEKIIEGSKNLIKKGKKAFISGVLGLSLIVSSGCSWKYSGSFYITEDIKPIQKTELVGTRKKLEYEIKDIITHKKEYYIKINETQNLYKLFHEFTILEKIEKEYEVYSNPTADHILVGLFLLPPIGTILAIASGIKWESSDECPLEFRHKFVTKMKHIYLLEEKLSGWCGLTKIKAVPQKPKITRTINDTKEYFLEPFKTIHNTKPKNIKVQASPKELFENYLTKTNNQGIATFLLNPKKLPFNKAFSKQTLEEKLKNSELINDIKEHIRDQLLKEIYKKIIKYPVELKFETKEEATSEEILEIKNDSKKTKTTIYTVPEEKIYMVLEEYINREINSKIKEVRIRVKDASTHTPVRNANLEIKTQAPTKLELAKRYFEDKLLKWSLTKIKDYITGTETIKYDDNGTAVFSAYILNNYKTETTHPKYRFVILNFDFSNKKLKKTIYMSKDPKLIKIVDE